MIAFQQTSTQYSNELYKKLEEEKEEERGREVRRVKEEGREVGRVKEGGGRGRSGGGVAGKEEGCIYSFHPQNF